MLDHNQQNGKSVILLAMHGMPPSDFPAKEKGEYFRLFSSSSHDSSGVDLGEKHSRLQKLENKMRNWPRTKENDPFYYASMELKDSLKEKTDCEVVVGFGEFCSPDFQMAFDEAVELGASRVIVVTPMMIRGGSHSEIDIPEAIQMAKNRYPDLSIIYSWPFSNQKIASLLADQIHEFSDKA